MYNLLSPERVLKLIRFWPPYFFAGISVDSFNLEQKTVTSKLKLGLLNKNYFGTHFGGSLFAMCDPFYVFLLSHCLGRGYYVWDKKSEIEFVKAVREPVYATFSFSSEQIEEIKSMTEAGEKYEPEVQTVVKTRDGEVVARVTKILYIKKKKPADKRTTS